MRYSNLSRSDIIKSITIAIVTSIALLALSFSLGAETVDINIILLKQIETLQTQNEQLQALITALTEQIKALTATPATPIQSATIIGKPNLASPRQIDQAPIRDEKARDYSEKLEQIFPEDVELREICDEMLVNKSSSDMMVSMRKQLEDWIDNAPITRGSRKGKPARDTYPDCPYSQKQLAWAAWSVFPDIYEYPYDIKSLYPNGNPKPARTKVSLASMKKGK